MPRKKQGLRSYHHKSRNGCTNCKRRRVKCDAQAPVCANCFRRNETCTYPSLDPPSRHSNSPNPTSELAIIGPSSANGVSSYIESVSPFDPTLPTELSLDNPTRAATTSYAPLPPLLSHPSPLSGTLEALTSNTLSFTSCLSLLLCNSWFSTYEASLWIPVLASTSEKFRYVQHCFFSLSCLCRDRINAPLGSRFTPTAAYQHQVAALSLFNKSGTPVIDGENWIAVLTFGVCMIVFQLSVQEACPEEDFDYVGTLKVLRNAMAINIHAIPYLKKSPHWPLIVHRNTIPKKTLDSKLQKSLRLLEDHISNQLERNAEDDDEEEKAEITRQAFEELRIWTQGCQGIPRTWRAYCDWPSNCNSGFLDLLSEGDDIALLVFIHWCTIMYLSPKRWFVTAWAKRAAMAAMSKLNADWSDLLSWPWETLSTLPAWPTRAQGPTSLSTGGIILPSGVHVQETDMKMLDAITQSARMMV